jgi:hypothetical protein
MRQVVNGLQLIDVMLCCNDEYGNTSDVIRGFQVGDDLMKFDNFDGEAFKFVKGGFQIGDQVFAHHGHKSWVGNMAWDCCWVTLDVAAALVNHLQAQDSWTLEEAVSRLYDKWDAKQEFTRRDFR